MDGQMKASFGVSDESENRRRSETTVRFYDLILRSVAMLLTLAAAIVIGVDKQTKTVPFHITAELPPLYIPVTARWHYLSALVYFVVANATACSYAAFSLLVSAVKKGRSLRWAIIVMDILTVALLFSGVGAAAAVSVIGRQGNSHLKWNKICNVFGRFCGQGAASLLLSLLGATSFLSLVVVATLRIEKESSAK